MTRSTAERSLATFVAIFAAIVGLLVGTPVLRLQGDYLAIVTLAFGEIIADLINCLLVGNVKPEAYGQMAGKCRQFQPAF